MSVFHAEWLVILRTQESARRDYELLIAQPPVLNFTYHCRNETKRIGFGPLTCFQLSDMLNWIEFLAVKWVWLPEFVRRVTIPGNFSQDTDNMNAGPFVKVTVGACCQCVLPVRAGAVVRVRCRSTPVHCF